MKTGDERNVSFSGTSYADIAQDPPSIPLRCRVGFHKWGLWRKEVQRRSVSVGGIYDLVIKVRNCLGCNRFDEDVGS